jgi:hypothetical protein
MSCLSWNCRGLGNPRIVRVLHQLVKERKPNLVFLIETLCTQKKMEAVRCRLGYEGLFVVDPIGRSGGLALLWRQNRDLEIFNYSKSHIHAVIKDADGHPFWQFTGFYGHPDTARRWESWALLRHLKALLPLPWCCAGDFNEIVEQSDKEGAAFRRESQMVGFRDALEACGLCDLGFSGPCFTWCNHRSDGTFTKERLDRVVADRDWNSLFQSAVVQVLPACASDHHPLVVSFSVHPSDRRSFKRCFKFEAGWVKDEEYQNIVRNAWEEEVVGVRPIVDVQVKLSNCQRSLITWSKRKFGRDADLLKQKKAHLLLLQQRVRPASVVSIKCLQAEIEEILERDDMRWKQRSKQNWYLKGDRNTQYFHSWANQRRKMNTIHSITDGEGRIWRDPKEVCSKFLSYFEHLFQTQGPVGVDFCLESMESRVTPAMNARLILHFHEEEVRLALFQMHPLKSPGPDGYSAGFYQQSWDIVGSDVTRAALHFLNGGPFESGLNSTNICLIPKGSAPTHASDYRPISLCNVLYKVIAKVLANRLKHVLPSIISPEQSAFIPGRLITDNVLVAFETLHTMDSCLKAKEGFMALNLDMSKAYDRLEWDFLEATTRKLGFASRWIHLLMSCVRTVSYSVLINGQPHGNIVPTRGIRQGDPLSPYFFIICAEALSSMIQRSARIEDITGVSSSHRGPIIHHLLFADDSLLFCRANLREWRSIQALLDSYEIASGKQLNRRRTSVFFSRNTKGDARESILQAMGVSSTNSYEKYLGLPAFNWTVENFNVQWY